MWIAGDREELTFGAVVTAWLSCASANGLSRLVQGNKITKVVWSIIILAAYCFVSTHISLLVKRYFEYPTAFQYRLEKALVEMPDVTICRIGSLKYQANNYDRQFRMTRDEELIGEINSQMWEKLFYKENNIDQLRYSPFMYSRAAYFTKREAQRRSLSIGAYLIFCNYMGEPCSEKDFVEYIDTVFYKCYTFKPKKRSVAMSGPVLDIGLSTLPNKMEGSYDFIVLVHEKGTQPQMFRFGTKVKQGKQTNINVETFTISLLNLPVPGLSCVKNKRIFIPDAGELNTFKYSTEICFHDKIQRKIQDICKCWSPIARGASTNYSLPSCLANSKDLIVIPESYDDTNKENTNTSTEFRDPVFIPDLLQYFSYSRRFYQQMDRKSQIIENFVKEASAKLACHQKIFVNFSKNFLDINNCLHPCDWIKYKIIATNEDITEAQKKAIRMYVESKKSPKMKMDTHQGVVPLPGAIPGAENVPPPPEGIIDTRIKLTPDAEAKAETEKVKNSWLNMNYLSKTKKKRRTAGKPAPQSRNIDRGPPSPPTNKKKQDRGVALFSVILSSVPGDEITQVRLYTLPALFSEVGGVLGLWCGTSVISLFELIELLALLMSLLTKCCVTNNLREQEHQENSLELKKEQRTFLNERI